MWNGTMFVDLDGPLNASSLLSASAERLVFTLLCHGSLVRINMYYVFVEHRLGTFNALTC